MSLLISKKGLLRSPIHLSGSVDGVTKSFTLPRKTLKVIDVRSSQFPFVFRETLDWTFTGNTLTFTANSPTIQLTQTLTVLIETGFYS